MTRSGRYRGWTGAPGGGTCQASCGHQIPGRPRVVLAAGSAVDDRPDASDGLPDAFARQEVAGEEGDLPRSVPVMAREHAHVTACVNQAGNDVTSEAASAARDEDG